MLNLTEMVTDRKTRICYRAVLAAITNSLYPLNEMELSHALKMKNWELKAALKFWQEQKMIYQQKGEWLPTSDRN
ncbi:MAG: hypothetical protein ACM37W_17850 [Actinomycetota bacterium]